VDQRIRFFEGVELTPLAIAISSNNKQGVRWLIRTGADVNKIVGDTDNVSLEAIDKIISMAEDEYGEGFGVYKRTPLHVAADHVSLDLEIMRLLIENGANMDAANNRFQITPLTAALAMEKSTNAKMLIEHGANVNQAYYIDEETLKFFENEGLEFSDRTNQTCTPLHLAVTLDYDLVDRMIMAGADVNAPCTEYNFTPFDFAPVSETDDTYSLIELRLIEAGAVIENYDM